MLAILLIIVLIVAYKNASPKTKSIINCVIFTRIIKYFVTKRKKDRNDEKKWQNLLQ